MGLGFRVRDFGFRGVAPAAGAPAALGNRHAAAATAQVLLFA